MFTFALQIPADAGKEYNIPIETISTQIQSLHNIILFLVILLIISVSVNILFILLLWKFQNRLKEANLAVKNLNLGKEAIKEIFTHVQVSKFQDDEGSIEIIPRKKVEI